MTSYGLVTYLAVVVITVLVARGKGRSLIEGIALGAFLSLLGLIIELCLPGRDKQAAKLARQVKAARPLHLDGEGQRMLDDLRRDREHH